MDNLDRLGKCIYISLHNYKHPIVAEYAKPWAIITFDMHIYIYIYIYIYRTYINIIHYAVFEYCDSFGSFPLHAVNAGLFQIKRICSSHFACHLNY